MNSRYLTESLPDNKKTKRSTDDNINVNIDCLSEKVLHMTINDDLEPEYFYPDSFNSFNSNDNNNNNDDDGCSVLSDIAKLNKLLNDKSHLKMKNGKCQYCKYLAFVHEQMIINPGKGNYDVVDGPHDCKNLIN